MTSLHTTRALQRIASKLPLDAKRVTWRNEGVESWYPYYAGFSDRFARLILESIELPQKATVLDPWNGSGTTTHVADHLGHTAIGFDLNPIAALVANAKLARPRDAEHVLGLARRISTEALERSRDVSASKDPLSPWLRPSVVTQYRTIESAVLADLATGRTGKPVVPSSGATPPLAAFLLLALMRSARTLAGVRPSTNPTWVVPGGDRSGSRHELTKRWLECVGEMAEELSTEQKQKSTGSEASIADSRSLPLADSSVDFVLTSPPYCTRIDYVVSTSFELAALGLDRDSATFASLRRSAMGTPLARKGSTRDPEPSWPSSVRSVLEAIRTHSSKSSASYYYKTYWQYFSDCERSLRELHRCLRVGRAGVLVVQTSYYKDVCVDLPSLYLDMGKAIGLGGDIVGEVEVRRALAQINTRSMQHRETTSYRESVLTLEKVS
ncbi:MAG: hypothetical protein KF850_19995 [Labilithrix sp.]|nr:hypothetical protein [Labilithrix sp.]